VWGGARLLLWRDSLRMALDRPLAGFGPETFATEFPRFESVELARAYPDFYHESPHNMFLDILTSRGMGGLLFLAAMCGVAIWAALRGRRAELSAGLVGLLVCQQFVVFIPATALYFYLLAALLVAEPSAAPVEARTPLWLWPPAVATVVLLAIFGLHLLAADRSLAVTNQRIASGDAIGAAHEYQSVLRWQPPGAGADLAYSRSMAQLANRSTSVPMRVQAFQQALEAGIRATKTAEDRHNAWYNLAMLLATQNDATGVERSLRNAIAWAPKWFKPHWALAQMLEKTNRHREALAEARVAADLDGGRDPEVRQTLEMLLGVTSPQP
jgi:tetratricopeptide (TPR) repeat protein